MQIVIYNYDKWNCIVYINTLHYWGGLCLIDINNSKRVYNIKNAKTEDKARYINISLKNDIKDNFLINI